MAIVIPFPGRRRLPRPALRLTASPADVPMPFTAAWQREHLPLITQAIELLRSDDSELQRRCRVMAERGGRTLLDELSAQIETLGSHIGDVAIALSLAALRIRRTMKTLPA